jgi:hypothetical protein
LQLDTDLGGDFTTTTLSADDFLPSPGQNSDTPSLPVEPAGPPGRAHR